MKHQNKGRKRVVPQPGGESFQLGEAGPITYHMPMPATVTVVVPVGLDVWQIGEAGPTEAARALVPAAAEVAALPRGARAALALRCAARAAHPDAATPDAVAARLVAAATTRTPLRRQLLCIRHDFDRLARLAVEQHWTDETPVSQDVFGPLWPADLAPEWAKDPA